MAFNFANANYIYDLYLGYAFNWLPCLSFNKKNFDDYILGGRRLGSVVTALSAGASDMSGWLLMGLPGVVFFAGISESWIAIGLCLGAWLNWRLVAGRLRLQTEKTIMH